jgi:hypothetical protein
MDSMKIAIAQNYRLEGQGPWRTLGNTSDCYPSDIRARVEGLLEYEDMKGFEVHLITLDRTVLDMVTGAEAKNAGPIHYEDVFVWRDGSLVPLLDILSAEWMSHFALGDLLARGELDSSSAGV